MNEQRGTLVATERPHHIVARDEELEQIREAIYATDSSCRVIGIQGRGGFGKTRLLEEVLRRFSHEDTEKLYGPLPAKEQWPTDNIAYCHTIDFTDIKAHSREYFLGKLGSAEQWHVGTGDPSMDFRAFREKRESWQHLVNQGSAHGDVEKAAGEAIEAFWRDYHRAAARHRLVILLDTTEQLAVNSSEWLLERKLIEPRDTAFATQRWLLDEIAAGNFRNTTLLIAGRDRPEDGGQVFAALSAAAGEGYQKIAMTPFTLSQTRQYFEALLEDWSAAEGAKKSLAESALTAYRRIIDNENDALWVLHLYTGGQPVRLALYSDMLIEGGVPPQPLQDTWAEAQARIGIDVTGGEVDEDTLAPEQMEKLATIRKVIEGDLIRLLFQVGRGLQPLILRALARTPRGLNAEQLDFFLNSTARQSPDEWQSDPVKLKAIEAALRDIQSLAIVRAKPDDRYGVQDEVARIYAERMAEDEETRNREVRDRRHLYQRLLLWTEHRRKGLLQEWRKWVNSEVDGIQIREFARASDVSVDRPSFHEQQDREKLYAELLDAELERVHYRLLIKPDVQFNALYVGLIIAASEDYQEALAVMVQAEMWWVLIDPAAKRFFDLRSRDVIDERGESPYQVLLRAVRQDDAVQWILRYFMYKQYDRAIELAEAIEREAKTLKDANERHSWNHTLARADRACWREFCRIYRNQDRRELEQAINTLGAFANDLQKLAAATQDKMVFTERNEKGFKGHPAEDRVKIVLSQLCNNQGYGYTVLGDFRQAVRAYTRGLQALRNVTGEETEALQAATRNNLSRALAELGKQRSVEVCRDGLAMRRKQGSLIAIGLSLNTLALIWNDFRRPEPANEAAQRALAIGKYTLDQRLRGLALLQVGESLRRIAIEKRADAAHVHEADEIFQEARRALDEAELIFTEPVATDVQADGDSGEQRPKWREPVRVVETYMELGSLYRDWTRHSDEDTPSDTVTRRLRDALDYLQLALAVSRRHGLNHFELDALVNIAQAHFYAGQYDEAEQRLGEALKAVPEREQFSYRSKPPAPANCLGFNLKQLSKLHGLQGEIAFAQLRERTAALAKEHGKTSVDRQRIAEKDEQVKRLTEKAAVAYTLATSYARLYSPGSELLAILYRDLYARLKELNATEMAAFYRHEDKARRDYRIDEVKPDDQGDLENFLRDCFGDFYKPQVRISEAAVSAELPLE